MHAHNRTHYHTQKLLFQLAVNLSLSLTMNFVCCGFQGKKGRKIKTSKQINAKWHAPNELIRLFFLQIS